VCAVLFDDDDDDDDDTVVLVLVVVLYSFVILCRYLSLRLFLFRGGNKAAMSMTTA